MRPEPGFQTLQHAFAAHLRDPEHQPAPEGLEERRLQIYRDLFYNNIEGFLTSGFPVLRSLMTPEQWQALARDFLARHRCKTPYFLEIGQEFLVYLEQERLPAASDFPFLLELAHYEWVELALSISDDEPDPARFDAEADLLDGIPLLSPLAWPLAYRFPVHRIGPGFIPQEPPPEPSFLVVYRDADDRVHFMAVNPVTARLLEQLQEGKEITGRELLMHMATELAHPAPEQLLLAGAETLRDLQKRGILLGTRR